MSFTQKNQEGGGIVQQNTKLQIYHQTAIG